MPSLSRNILTLLQLSCTASTAHPHCWAWKPPSKNASCTQETPYLCIMYCLTAFITRLLGTAFQSLMWPVDDIFILSGVITLLCLDTVSACMGVGHLLLSAQLPGTHWVMICVIRCLALTVSDVCLKFRFLADHSNGCAIGTVLRLSVVCLSVTLCIVAKRCVLQQKLLLRAYRKSYMRNWLVPKWMTLTFVYRSCQGHVNHCVTFDVEYLRNC